MPTATQAAAAVSTLNALQGPMGRAIEQAIDSLTAHGVPQAKAVAFVASQLIAEVSDVLASRAGLDRSAEGCSFEALVDVNDAASHFQAALLRGIEAAALKIEADGFDKGDAVVLAGSRALDLVADMLTAAAR